MHQALVSSTSARLNQYACLQLAPAISQVHNTLSLHSCLCAHIWPWPPSLALALTTMHVHAAIPCYHLGTCNKHPQLSVYTPPAPATTATSPIPFSTGTVGDILMGLNNPFSHCGPAMILTTKNHIVINAMDPSCLSQHDTISPQTQSQHLHLCMAPHTTRLGATAYSGVPLPTS